MKPNACDNKPSRRALRVLIWAVALTGIACAGDMNINPAAPTFDFPFEPDGPPGSGRNLEIVGTLKAEGGSCLEATVLYDGEELRGARTVCRKASGCATMELRAFALSGTGPHTISFQVLRQSTRAVAYLAEGTVRVTRDNIFLGGVTLSLQPTRARLRSGESVSFDFELRN